MNVSVPIPTALPTPPGGGRGLPQAEPSRAGSPFAGLLGEQRLALARAGDARHGRRTDDAATDRNDDAGPKLTEPPAAPVAAETRPADGQPAADETPVDPTHPETPAPMLDWFATWQPEPAIARGLPGADAAAAVPTEPAPTASDLTAVESADARSGPARRPDAAAIAADTIADARGRLALRAASHDALQARAHDEAGRAERPAEILQSKAVQSEGEHLLAKDMTPARADPPVAEARSADTTAALLAPPAAAPPAASSAAPVLTLATPLGSPDFSQALAAQLTTLARDGVHEAQLQLNPAEMGPIAVQIVVDGSQAQVDFAAAQAATRQALEASLPSLAAALQTLGLTLSGGGVFEQGSASHDERPGEPASRGPRRVGGSGEPSAIGGQTVALRARAGLLDLYA
ncbi:flagellar hook-length control protein FliK [uncultured Methylibium sp.]|uniref:flagellar hook-length control protein FliK n=1 Tax=uncultured Methylibium sp. TaxID=381093 RepID=UPI0025CE455B|nr:flagellar hook-length control protein FliK [uncultured Methylibium sp.]